MGCLNINVVEVFVFYLVFCCNVNFMGNKDVKGYGLCVREFVVVV